MKTRVGGESHCDSLVAGSYFVHTVSQIQPGRRPDVFCTATGCTGEGVFHGTIGGVPVTTLMSPQMAAGCIPRHQ